MVNSISLLRPKKILASYCCFFIKPIEHFTISVRHYNIYVFALKRKKGFFIHAIYT
jgi:hypothetical protein